MIASMTLVLSLVALVETRGRASADQSGLGDDAVEFLVGWLDGDRLNLLRGIGIAIGARRVQSPQFL